MIRRPVPPRGRNRRLQEGEEQRLLDAADSGRNPFMRAMITLAIETAMRQGEILSLTWDNVDLDRRVAHLPMTKNGDTRDVPLSQRATETLRGLAGERPGPMVIDTPPRAPLSKPGGISVAGRA
ncbi:site-specific integrase [Fulvimarina sp. MAC3]|uniref:site-specific integrase n=1 Tax=Fulvimarina sp. MAC3 TaxID=3148887 RepID=UPI0031FDB788